MWCLWLFQPKRFPTPALQGGPINRKRKFERIGRGTWYKKPLSKTIKLTLTVKKKTILFDQYIIIMKAINDCRVQLYGLR